MTITCREVYTLDVPADVKRVLVEEGGLNRYREPNYRLVWGWSRLETRAGEFHEFDDSGNETGVRLEVRREPKYWPRDRFHLEVWVPPETYGSPADWFAITKKYVRGESVEHLGEYPHRGDYERVSVCQTPSGDFVMPTAEAVRDMVRWHRAALLRTSAEKKAEFDARDEYEKNASRSRMHDIIDTYAKAFPFRTWVPVSGPLPKQVSAA